MVRMQKRAQMTRRRILSAARRLFSLQGYHGTRVDAIARRARVNKQRIYAYFGNKEGLFVAVLQRVVEDVMRGEEKLLSLIEDDVPNLPELLLKHYLRFHEKHPSLWRLLAWENLEGGRHVQALRGLKNPVFDHIRVLYRKGQEQGALDPGVSFEAFMYSIFALTYFYHSNRRTMTETLGIDLASADVQETLVREMIRFFRPPHGSTPLREPPNA
jgi:AcrR family transcriptional regulator